MTRRKTKAPAAPTSWCRLHERYMNDAYIHRRRCCLKGRRGPCKHLEWLKGVANEKGKTQVKQ
nr:MAG TPA: hypothetical protein [Bacteriophage sp.]